MPQPSASAARTPLCQGAAGAAGAGWGAGRGAGRGAGQGAGQGVGGASRWGRMPPESLQYSIEFGQLRIVIVRVNPSRMTY